MIFKNQALNIFLYFLIIVLLVINIFITIFAQENISSIDYFNNNILKCVEIKSSNDENSWGFASGFFIDDSGKILTNKHVVFDSQVNQNYNYIQIRLANGVNWLDASIVEVSENYDLAVIKADLVNTSFFTFSNEVLNGEDVYTIGNPNGFGLSFNQGVVSNRLRTISNNGETFEVIQTSFVINEGNSGGAVFNKHGKLIGIISFRLRDNANEVIQGVGFAVPIQNIKIFLDYNK